MVRLSAVLTTTSIYHRALAVAYILYVCIISCCERCHRGFCICHDEQRTYRQVSKATSSYYPLLNCSHNYLLMASSVLYLLASYVLAGLCGSTGLILANCVNMAVRIVCSLKFIRDFFSTTSYHPLRWSLPSLQLLLTFILTSLITALSEVT